jgi:hypothetical protein
MLGTCDCCAYAINRAARVRAYSWLWGFPKLKPIQRAYTVGTGWDNTAITTGMVAKRVSAGVITGLYEALSSFTAAADPASDTSRWRHAGLTATAGESNYWYNIDPIYKWTAVAIYQVGTGWLLPFPHVFPRQLQGTVVRYGSALRVMTSSSGFSTTPANDAHWADYSGPASDAEYDYQFSRYCRLVFAVGDLVARLNGSTWSFYRCRAAVDYRALSDGAGDPATDTGHWEPYTATRSLPLDFTRATLVSGSPWHHYTPAPRYLRWRETTEIFFGDTSLGTKTREFIRDSISGRITTVTDEWASSWTVAAPPPPSGEDTSGTFYPDYPSTTPGYWTWVGVNFHYHRPKISSLTLNRCIYPDTTLQLQWTAAYWTTTSHASYFFTNPSGRSTTMPPWQPEPWPGPPHHYDLFASQNLNLALTSITSTDTAIAYEWTGTVDWWHEFDVGCVFAAKPNEPYNVYYDLAWSRLGKVAGSGGTVAAADFTAWVASDAGFSPGINTIHQATIRIIQTVQLLDALDWSTHIAAAAAVMPGFPGWGNFSSGNILRTGSYLGAVSSYSFGDATADWAYILRSNDLSSLPGYSWADSRLIESQAELSKAYWDVSSAPSWFISQVIGESEVSDESLDPVTWSADPSDAVVRRAKVTLTAP